MPAPRAEEIAPKAARVESKREAGNVLDQIKSSIKKLTEKNKEDVAKLYDDVRKAAGEAATTATQNLEKRLAEEVVPELRELKRFEKEMRRIIKEEDANEQKANGRRRSESKFLSEYKSAGRRLVECDSYDRALKAAKWPEQIAFEQIKSRLWPTRRELAQLMYARHVARGMMHSKASAALLDEGQIGAWVTPEYGDALIELPKIMPVLRRFLRVRPVSSDQLIADREVEEEGIVMTVREAASSGAGSLTVDSTSGIEASAPFNSLLGDNGSSTETLTVDSFTETVITLSGTTTLNYAVGDKVTLNQISTTPEGQLAPLSSVEVEDYTVEIGRIAVAKKVTLEKLRDVAALERWINTRLMSLLGRAEDMNLFYGVGGGTKKITGFFTDAAVAAFGNWSAQAVGTTSVDYIFDAFYDLLSGANPYEADACLLTPGGHKIVRKEKGTDGHFLLFNKDQVGGPVELGLIELAWSSTLRNTDGLIGDFGMCAQICDREDASVEVGLEDDDLRRHKRTAVASERVGLEIGLPGGFRELNLNSRPSPVS